MGIELSETQQKTAKTCHNMFVKWQKTQEGKTEKDKTVAHYIKACIEGYPKGTKLLPNIISIRLKGIKNFAAMNGLTISEAEFTKAGDLLGKYKTKFNEEKKKEEA